MKTMVNGLKKKAFLALVAAMARLALIPGKSFACAMNYNEPEMYPEHLMH